MKIPYSTNGTSWTFFKGTKVIKITNEDPRYQDISDAVFNNDEEKLLGLLEQSTAAYTAKVIVDTINIDGLDIVTFGDNIIVKYNGIELPKVLSEKLHTLYLAGCKDFTHYKRFIERLFMNTGERNRTELYRFLESAELPITQDGKFIAYKGVQHDLYSVRGNTSTRVLSGTTKNGKIYNGLGETISVLPEDVDTDCESTCSYGLHVGSYAYAKGWGHTVVAVEVDPANVISVPTDCNSEKCRVTTYRVMNILESEFSTPDVIVDHENATVDCTAYEPVQEQTHGGILDKLLSSVEIISVRKMIERNIENNVLADGTVGTTVRQLAGSLGRKYGINYSTILAVLLRLGYNVTVNETMGESTVTL